MATFPQSQNVTRSRANFQNAIIKDPRPALQAQTVKSVHEIIALIVAKCREVFHQHDISGVLTFFQPSQMQLVRWKTSNLKRSRGFAKRLQWFEADHGKDTSQSLDFLFTISKEVSLIARAKTIINDLHKIDFICSQQQDVLPFLNTLSKPSPQHW